MNVFRLIRIVIFLLITVCFTVNSFAMTFSMNSIQMNTESYQHDVMLHCKTNKVIEQDSIQKNKFDHSICQKSLCCVAIISEPNVQSSNDFLPLLHPLFLDYKNQLTIGILNPPYRPPKA